MLILIFTLFPFFSQWQCYNDHLHTLLWSLCLHILLEQITWTLLNTSTFKTSVDANRLSFNKTYTNLHSHQYLLPHQNGRYYHYLNFCPFGKLFSCWLFWLPERSTTLSCLLSITFLPPWSDFLYLLLIFLLEFFLLLFTWSVDLLRVMGNSPLICYVPCKYFLPSSASIFILLWWS